MTNEERDLITRFIQRVAGAPAGFAGSVPATTQAGPPPAPIDPEADALIADLFNRSPEARYRITQLAFVQEHALVEAQNLINRLQYELQQAKQAQAAPPPAASPWGAAAQQQPQPQPSRGILGGLFGGGQPQPPPPPQYAPPPPQYAPGYQPGMFARQGPGFLGSALTTAAGVAGGLVAGQALMNLFTGNHGGFGGGYGGGFGGGMPAGFMPTPAASPWGDAAAAAPATDPYDVGGAPKDSSDTGWTGADPGAQQPADTGWQDSSATDSGWQDASAAAPDTDDSGWTDTSGTSGAGGFDTTNC